MSLKLKKLRTKCNKIISQLCTPNNKQMKIYNETSSASFVKALLVGKDFSITEDI